MTRVAVVSGGTRGIGEAISKALKGAGTGAIVGGGLGAAGAWFSKGKEAVVKRDTQFGVVLNQSIALPAANVR